MGPVVRVVHIIPTLDPADGGPPVIVERLAAAQAALGAEVSVLYTERPGAEEGVRASIDETPGGDRLRLCPVPAPTGLDRFTGRMAARVASGLVSEGIDFVHFHGVWAPMLAASARLCTHSNVPYCVATHGMVDHWSLARKRLKKKIAMSLVWRDILNRAAFLHTGNQHEASLMAPLGISAPTEIIPNGIFIEEFDRLPAAGDFRARRPELVGDPYILFLSRLHYKKGLDLLAPAFVRVLERLPQTRLVVAGPDDGAREPFLRQIRSLGIDERTHVIGPIYGQEKLAALRDAACFCLPSRQEGFSIAITEALACGVPSVVTADCHFPEVGEAGAGRVTTLEPAHIAEALIDTLADPVAAQAMGAAGARLVRERFTWPRIAEQTLAAYENRKPQR